MNDSDSSCAVALKEWSATVRALETGRQILLLRKGGLLDPDGAFELEYSAFWLAPTRFHQDENGVKPAHRDLLQAPPAARGVLALRSLARVARTWTIFEDEAARLAQLDHIWSTRWLDTRFDYQPERPILCVALRVWVLPEPYRVPMKAEYSGCKSWIEMDDSLSFAKAAPALDDDSFSRQLADAGRVLGA